MDEINKDLLKEYREYKIKNGPIISNKQLHYINNLIKLIDDTLKVKIKEETLIIKFCQTLDIVDMDIKEILHKLSINNNLDDNDIFSLIELLKKYVSASFSEILSIFNIYNKQDIERLLKLDDKQKLFISIKDAQFLLGGPDKFKPWIKEHPIVCEDEFEYGWQESELCQDRKLFYLKFYNMMMIDIDNQNLKNDELISSLKQIKMFHFRLYKTYNGYHIFITSQLIKYNDPKVMEITRILKGDLFYAMFSNKTGFKIRLNKKLNRLEEKVVEYIGEVGNCKEDKICIDLINIYNKYINLH